MSKDPTNSLWTKMDQITNVIFEKKMKLVMSCTGRACMIPGGPKLAPVAVSLVMMPATVDEYIFSDS